MTGDEVPRREDAKIYWVHETSNHLRNFFKGYVVGFYHNPHAEVDHKCLDIKDYRDFGFILGMVYERKNILHFLDIFKVAGKITELTESIFEFCGPKMIIEDVRDFCKIDPKRCTAPVMLTNGWRRMFVISAQALRIVVDTVKLCYYAIYRNSMSEASKEAGDKIYDIADDIGSIFRYTLDFHIDEEVDIGEFDLFD